MIRLILFFTFGLGGFCLTLMAARADLSTNAAPVAPKVPAIKRAAAPRAPLYRDATIYPPLQLTWNPSSDLGEVLHVFAHPYLPELAIATTQSGVFLTGDAGHTWKELSEATSEKVGVVNDIAFHPSDAGTFYLSSATSGLWMTTDGGATFRQIGSKKNGMASDTVAGAIVYPGDPSGQTLLAVHGDAAPGLSRSRDGGQTWDVLNADYRFSRVLGSEGNAADLYLIGSSPQQPDVVDLFGCSSLGEFVVELMHDIVPTDVNIPPVRLGKQPSVYLTTSDNGLYRLDKEVGDETSRDIKQLPVPDVTGWASVGMTWGPSADVLDLFLFDPAKLGLVISPDQMATVQTASDGLPVGPLVKEGAEVRPNANGTVFYAVVNGALSIGRQAADVPVVDVTPGTFTVDPQADGKWRKLSGAFRIFADAKESTAAAARALVRTAGDLLADYNARKITITARVPITPSPPQSVTVDLSRYGGEPDTPLFDDGRHDDGAAADGVYGLTFAFQPEKFRENSSSGEWRTGWPGRVAVGVKVAYEDGRNRGAVGVISINSKTADFDFWSTDPKSIKVIAQGAAAAEEAPNPAEIHNGKPALRIDARTGSWTVACPVPWFRHDITSYEAISFWIRLGDGAAPKEIFAQMSDKPDLSAPTTTAPIPVLRGLGLTAGYQRVVVPISQMISSTPQFQADHVVSVTFSGQTTANATLYIDGLRAVAHDDSAASASPPSQ